MGENGEIMNSVTACRLSSSHFKSLEYWRERRVQLELSHRISHLLIPYNNSTCFSRINPTTSLLRLCLNFFKKNNKLLHDTHLVLNFNNIRVTIRSMSLAFVMCIEITDKFWNRIFIWIRMQIQGFRVHQPQTTWMNLLILKNKIHLW